MKFEYLSKIMPPEYNNVWFRVCSGYSDIHLLMWQPKCTLSYSHKNGMCIAESESERFNGKAKEFITYASDKADLLITPEGCFPWKLLDQILKDKKMWPRDNALWCLCMQGIEKNTFSKWFNVFESKPYLFIPSVDNLLKEDANKKYVNLLFYLFKTDDSKKLFVIPQAKLGAMKDNDYLGEGADLCEGTTTYIVDLVDPKQQAFKNILITAICADTFWLDYNELGNCCKGQNLILLHPQCCCKPWSPSFCKLQNYVLDNLNACVQYIPLNWASSTNFDDCATISAPLSMIKCSDNVDNTDQILETSTFRNKIAVNQKSHLSFFYDTDKHSAEWCLYPFEQIIHIILSNTKVNSCNGATTSYNHPIAKEVICFLKGKWETYTQCNLDIIKKLKQSEVVRSFLPQIQICVGMSNSICNNNIGSCQVCQLDDFFSRCFGNENGLQELKYTGLHKRIVTSTYNNSVLDDGREKMIFKFVSLCKALKAGLPSQYGNSKFHFEVCPPSNKSISNFCINDNCHAIAVICDKEEKGAEKLYAELQNYRDDGNVILYYASNGDYVPFEKGQINTNIVLGSGKSLKSNSIRITSIFGTLFECIKKLLTKSGRDLNEH